jgi:hypothetical protein
MGIISRACVVTQGGPRVVEKRKMSAFEHAGQLSLWELNDVSRPPIKVR